MEERELKGTPAIGNCIGKQLDVFLSTHETNYRTAIRGNHFTTKTISWIITICDYIRITS